MILPDYFIRASDVHVEKPKQLNVRLTDSDAELLAVLAKSYPHMSEAERVRHAIRVGTFVAHQALNGRVDYKELVKYLNVFRKYC